MRVPPRLLTKKSKSLVVNDWFEVDANVDADVDVDDDADGDDDADVNVVVGVDRVQW